MGLRPTQGNEKRLLFSNYSVWKPRPPLCHLDRSVPGFPTSLLLATTTSAALRIESRMQIINATDLDRKSGGTRISYFTAASDDHVCGSPYREPHADRQRHGSRQEIRGTAVERSAVQRSFLGNVFR